MEIEKFGYEPGQLPHGYVCGNCMTSGCKLWRESATSAPQLRCCDCAAKQCKRDIAGLDETGRYPGKFGMTDQIGWFVPAVPSPNNLSFYTYTGVPDAAIAWWRSLPTRSTADG